jgi:hypothetical protein
LWAVNRRLSSESKRAHDARGKIMNSKNIPEVGDNSRRTFLKTLAALGGGLVAARVAGGPNPLAHYPAKHAGHFHLDIEGTGDFRHVVGYQWPDIFNQFPPDLKFRVRYRFPVEHRDILSLLIFAAPDPEDALVGQPVPDAMLISGGNIWIDEIRVGPPVEHPVYGPKPTLGMLGRFITNPIASPFGTIVGRTCCWSCAFDGQGDDVTLYLVGIMSAGSHATFTHESRGALHFRGY